jgi:hypothetical protein
VDELLQKHRTFTLSVAVGGFVFLLAILLRGCAIYDRDLEADRKSREAEAQALTKEPVPDEKYLKELDRVVAESDARVADLAREVGRTEKGEALWDACIGDVLRTIGKDSPEARRALLEQARRLPAAAFSLLLSDVREVFLSRAASNDVEIGDPDFGFQQVQDAGFSRSVAALAAICRIVDRGIALGVDKVEQVAVSGTVAGAGGGETDPFVNTVPVRIKLRGDPAVLLRLANSLNDRDRDGAGRRIVLDEIATLGRPEGIRATEPGVAEFTVKVFLVNLEAMEETAP